MAKIFKFFKCRGCARVHVGCTKAEARDEVDEFNIYYASLSEEDRRRDYGGKCLSIELFKKCRYCGATGTEFIRALGYENSGLTMHSIIYRHDEGE